MQAPKEERQKYLCPVCKSSNIYFYYPRFFSNGNVVHGAWCMTCQGLSKITMKVEKVEIVERSGH